MKIPALENWISGTTWVAAIAFVIAVLYFIKEAKEIFSSNSIEYFKLFLPTALLVSVFLAWWASAVQESQGSRHLTQSQKKRIVKVASEFCPTVSVNVATNLMDPEAREYAKEFVTVLNKVSGCSSTLNESINPLGDLMGAHIGIRRNNTDQGAENLYRIFQKSGIDIKPDLYLRDTDFPGLPFVLAIGAKPRE